MRCPATDPNWLDTWRPQQSKYLHSLRDFGSLLPSPGRMLQALGMAHLARQPARLTSSRSSDSGSFVAACWLGAKVANCEGPREPQKGASDSRLTDSSAAQVNRACRGAEPSDPMALREDALKHRGLEASEYC